MAKPPKDAPPYKGGWTRPKKADDTDAQIARINLLTQTAKTSWFGLLSYLAFVGVTLMGVEDADFFIPERQTQLPLVGVAIPTYLFFYLGPFLGMVLFSYFHLHVTKLWEALGSAEEKVGNDHLGDRITPWLVSDYGLSKRYGAVPERPLQSIANWAAWALVFVSGPAVLGWLWWRSFPAHDEAMTVIACGLPLSLTVYVALKSWAHLLITAADIDLFGILKMPKAANAFWLILFVTTVFGWLRTEGTLEHYARHGFGFERFRMTDEDIETSRWATWGTNVFLKEAKLSNVNFRAGTAALLNYDAARRQFRKQWCSDFGVPTQACSLDSDTSRSAADYLEQERRRWCSRDERSDDDCKKLFLYLEARLRRDWVEYRLSEIALLRSASSSKLDLRGADLRNADLEGARLEGALLEEARLDDANLNRARLQGAGLRFAFLTRASLRGAQMEMARLENSRLAGADFRNTGIEGAVLRGASWHLAKNWEHARLTKDTLLAGGRH